MKESIQFTGGANIALKIPKYKYEETVHYYKEVLGLQVKEEPITSPSVSRTHSVVFGANTLWLDCVDNYTHPEIWLELNTPDVPAATEYLSARGITTKDEFEKIPSDKHWVTDPAGTVMIVSTPERTGQYD